ncbi:hypothetical protein V8C86DRAFT_3198017, partial [Haematococcus lacustris]
EVTELPSFRQHIDQVKEVVHYFLHLQLPRELLLQHRAATAAAAATTTAATTVSVKQVKLVQMSQTRFASLQDMLCSVQHNKSALRSVAISDSLGNDARSRNVIALVLNPDFWEKNEWIVGTLAPAAKLVEALQADAANLAHVHFGLMAVEDKLDKVTRSFVAVARAIDVALVAFFYENGAAATMTATTWASNLKSATTTTFTTCHSLSLSLTSLWSNAWHGTTHVSATAQSSVCHNVLQVVFMVPCIRRGSLAKRMQMMNRMMK